MEIIIDIFMIVLMIVSVYFILKKIDPNFAINTKRVICPKCKIKLPIIRMPKSLKQAVWGGHTCPKCGIELDQFGNTID